MTFKFCHFIVKKIAFKFFLFPYVSNRIMLKKIIAMSFESYYLLLEKKWHCLKFDILLLKIWQ